MLSSIKGKEKFFQERPAEADILYIKAQSLEKIDETYEAARTYFKILSLRMETNLKEKSDERLKKLISKELPFPDLKRLASNYAKTPLGAYTMYFAGIKGMEEGREKDAKKIYSTMKELYPEDKWINDGDAVVIKPGGHMVAGPHTRDKSILYADIDIAASQRARRSLDVAGHYSRPDIFSLSVDRSGLAPAKFED